MGSLDTLSEQAVDETVESGMEDVCKSKVWPGQEEDESREICLQK